MIRMMIVDDEIVERQALHLIITRTFPRVEVVGEADNGRKAIELAHLLRPDFISMDIRMPGIDGVEAVKQIKWLVPETRFIMVSAFDTFEYARELMREGVREYLLKPGKKDQIVESVGRILNEIEAEKEAEWVTSLLMDDVRDISVHQWSEMLGLEIYAGYAMLLTISGAEDALWKQDKAKLYNWLKMKLKQQFTCVVGPMMGMRIPVFILLDENSFRNFHGSNKHHTIQWIHQFINQFAHTFQGMHVSIGTGAPYSSVEGFVNSYHEALLAAKETVNSDLKEVLQPAKEYITRNYAQDLSLELVADHINLSPYYFSKMFKERYGITFIDYLTKIRIERAKELIVNPELSLKEICFQVGYRDPNYFSRVFKKTTGMSPGEYRASHMFRER